MTAFTDKMGRALAHYATSGNKTAAYRSAYNCGGSNPRTVNRDAIELFARPAMRAAVDSMRAVAAAKCDVTAEWVLHRAKLLADFNINKFSYVDHDVPEDPDARDNSGKPYYDFSNATDDDWYCISEMTIGTVVKGMGDDKYEIERVKLKGESKIKALEMVAKLGGMPGYSNKLEVEHSGVMMAAISTEQYMEARALMLEQDDC